MGARLLISLVAAEVEKGFVENSRIDWDKTGFC